MENKKASNNILHIRLDPDLKRSALAEAERNNLTLTDYVTNLIEENLEWQQLHPYIILKEHNIVEVTRDFDFILQTQQTLLLLKDTGEYACHIDFNLDKVRKFIKEKRGSKSIWSKNKDDFKILIKDNFDGQNITLKGKIGDFHQLQTGGYKIVRFPTRSKGSILYVDVYGKFLKYALSTKVNRNSKYSQNLISHERDRILFTPIEPTDQFSIQLKLDKKLFEQDIKSKRLTENQILGSLSFEIRNLRQVRISEHLPLYGVNGLDLLQHQVNQSVSKDDHYFTVNLEIPRPLLGLFYCISWICPLESKLDSKLPDQ